jgi:glycosyltransferase involved in cell wall biosynthesis
MPCHNAERWLHVAVQSILDQSHRDLELIAINDGSTDSTGQILDDFARLDRRIEPVHLASNSGIVDALNIGLDMAKGAYIARMDADDISLPGRLRAQVDFMDSTRVDGCGAWFTEFGQGFPRAVRWPSSENGVHTSLLFQNVICHPTLLARRAIFDRNRYRNDYKLAEDYDLVGRASSEFRFRNIPEVLLRYRRHPNQATQARRGPMEDVTRKIRLAMLASRGIEFDPEEGRVHNQIRAPESILDPADLDKIEAWLIKLTNSLQGIEERSIAASQWIRACVRAAPLGMAMLKRFNKSPLGKLSGAGLSTSLDLAALSLMRLDYNGKAFNYLRRIGISA